MGGVDVESRAPLKGTHISLRQYLIVLYLYLEGHMLLHVPATTSGSRRILFTL